MFLKMIHQIYNTWKKYQNKRFQYQFARAELYSSFAPNTLVSQLLCANEMVFATFGVTGFSCHLP